MSRPNNPAANSDDNSDDVYNDDSMSLHANDDNVLVNDLTNILKNIRELEAEGKRSSSGLKHLIQELYRDEMIGKKVNKD